jgi:hypothetical protein
MTIRLVQAQPFPLAHPHHAGFRVYCQRLGVRLTRGHRDLQLMS